MSFSRAGDLMARGEAEARKEAEKLRAFSVPEEEYGEWRARLRTPASPPVVDAIQTVTSGVDPRQVFQAIRGGLAGSAVMEAKAPMALARNVKPGVRINLHIKDLGNALAAGHEVGVPLPLTAQLMEMLQALKVDGLGDADHGAIIRYYEKLAAVEVTERSGS